MVDKNITHIVSIKVEKLWDETNINWELDPKVNILIGKNGTGKTTLLNLLEATIIGTLNFNDSEFVSIKLSFNLDKYITVNKTNDSSAFTKILKENKNTQEEHFDLIQKFILSDIKDSKFISGFNMNTNMISEKEDMNGSNFSKVINFSKISTFELSLSDLKQTQNKQSSSIRTELDIVLAQLIDDFKGYQLKLRNLEKDETAVLDEKIKELSSKDTAKKEDLNELRTLIVKKEKKITDIYKQKHEFIKQIDFLFSNSGKKLEFDKENSLIFKKNEKYVTPYHLSSGEKQLLIILLTVILQENKPCIILMDEPEISLHLSWQLDLIDIIQNLNPNCQLIIVTHSPGVFTKGWKDKITKMEDIITE